MQFPSILSAALFSLLALSVQHAAGLAMGPTTTGPTTVEHKENSMDQKHEPTTHQGSMPTPSMMPGKSWDCPATYASCLVHSDDSSKFDYKKCDTKMQAPFEKCLTDFCP